MDSMKDLGWSVNHNQIEFEASITIDTTDLTDQEARTLSKALGIPIVTDVWEVPDPDEVTEVSYEWKAND